MRIKRRIDHLRECLAVQQVTNGTWDSVWTIDGRRPFEFLDAIGRNNRNRGGHYQWIRFRCNNPDCNAVLLVNEDDILASKGVPCA